MVVGAVVVVTDDSVEPGADVVGAADVDVGADVVVLDGRAVVVDVGRAVVVVDVGRMVVDVEVEVVTTDEVVDEVTGPVPDGPPRAT